ncbi:MAG: acyl-[acyl-carrier-protein] thioesterase [Bacteroidales bacterium]|jgi:medium-chain acyl-[acyl-carrier-protein] hydrolase|nr:acyl-[acyl-carrier-protein] thioesterase [Bacteroidales bacterium]MDI9544994.1 thioesterase [Bacteroidota bacterium]OQC02841.1 MAG: Acyl-ACP thioesterase [Bacteroidetes bacterium ADurb.Bin090]MBP8981946.1 acyl-[acyl-carrier-protein] thioesterase [Bacteroidales bacterium]HNZ80383.1 thioesterase [Bacteroidales bacterium]
MTGLPNYTYRILARDLDFTGRASLMSLCRYIFNTASKDAENNGFGTRELHNNNATWVISRMSFEMYATLREFDEFYINTWVNEISRLMTTRNLLLCDPEGKTLGAAVTQWAMIDVDSRTPMDLRENMNYSKAARFDIPCPINKPVKIIPGKESEPVLERKVVYSDLDFNRHVNSVKYLEWMLDMLPLENIINNGFSRLDMNYLREALYDDRLLLSYQQEDNHHLFDIKRKDETPVCRARIQWE